MNKRITVSAPGKLMLFGEHAVVYNHPCLVTAVDERMYATVEILEDKNFELHAPDVKVTDYKKPLSELGSGEVPKGAKFVEIAVKNFFEKYSLNTSIRVSTKSDFSSEFGFGSSSASTVCIVKALSELFGLHLGDKELFDISYKTVLDIQGKGSGFDVAAAVYGGVLRFVTGGKEIEPLNIPSLPLIVGYSGVKADTVALMNQVKELSNNNPGMVEEIYQEIEGIVRKARESLGKNDWQTLGGLMNKNQELLVKLGVSIPKIDNMISAALSAGAYGAKLSGAGGGDCIVCLAPEEKQTMVENAIIKEGGTIIHVSTGTRRVRTEK